MMISVHRIFERDRILFTIDCRKNVGEECIATLRRSIRCEQRNIKTCLTDEIAHLPHELFIIATAAFWIGRTLARDFAASLIGERLRKYDEAIGRNGFAVVLYLRLIHFPFTPLNFGMGITKVRFRDYFFGTGWGILVGVFLFTFFLGTLREVWAGGDWVRLLSPKAIFSLGLLVFSFLIPRIVRKIRKGREFWDGDVLD